MSLNARIHVRSSEVSCTAYEFTSLLASKRRILHL